MLSQTRISLSKFGVIPKRSLNVISGYVASLTLIAKKHTFVATAKIAGVDESRVCAMMNAEATPEMSMRLADRAARRRIARLPSGVAIKLIIDATIIKRSRRVENAGRWHSGSGLVWGHKFVNFVLVAGDEVIPLASLPCLTKKYAKARGQKYRTEIEIVRDWVEALHKSNLFAQARLRSLIFLLDCGYDAKPIQQMIHAIGANWVMAIKSSRSVDGGRAADFFKARKARIETIRLSAGSGGKRSRREYSVQTSVANLKGFGSIVIVRSKATFRKGKPEKILAASDPKMNARDVVRLYAERWLIETWHREVKQNFGFGDCKSSRFTSLESHINFCLTAYAVAKERGRGPVRKEDYEVKAALIAIRSEATRFGSAKRVREAIATALNDIAA